MTIEDNGSKQDPAPQGDKPLPQVWRLVLLLMAAFVLCHDLTDYYYILTRTPLGSLGARSADYCDSEGFCRLMRVRPASPMARSGARDGDEVRYDHPIDYMRPVAIGEDVGFTLRPRGVKGAESHYTVRTEARLSKARPAEVVTNLPSLVTTLVGVLLVLGGRRRVAATWLGGALICLGLAGTYADHWATAPPVYILAMIALVTLWTASGPLFILFARALRREVGGRDPRPWRIAQWSYIAVNATVVAYQVWATIAGRVLPGVGSLFEFSVVLNYAGFTLAALVLAAGWRESQGLARTRYGFMIVAMLLMAGQQIIGLAINLTGNDWSFTNPIFISYLVTPIVGVVVFAYALLRHRVVDLGFVINRTLIYGVLSSVILLTFGLAEWGIEKVLPFSHETSAIIEASVALGIFLVFHRIRDVIETVVEKLLFVRWHHNEARLRTFVTEASFIRKSSVLTEAFVAELSRFSGGADCRLFVADGSHGFVQAGDVEAVAMDGDDPLVIKLRATREVVETDTLLVAPMIHRAELTGFAILGLKQSGDTYRPDERSVLAWAAHQISLDLHTLEVERLELEVERLEDQATELRNLNAALAGQIQFARDLGALRPA